MSEMTEQKLVRAMVGREIKEFFGEKRNKGRQISKTPVLSVEGLYDNYDFLKKYFCLMHTVVRFLVSLA